MCCRAAPRPRAAYPGPRAGGSAAGHAGHGGPRGALLPAAAAGQPRQPGPALDPARRLAAAAALAGGRDLPAQLHPRAAPGVQLSSRLTILTMLPGPAPPRGVQAQLRRGGGGQDGRGPG